MTLPNQEMDSLLQNCSNTAASGGSSGLERTKRENPLPNYRNSARAQGTSGITYQKARSEVSKQAFWGQSRFKVCFGYFMRPEACGECYFSTSTLTHPPHLPPPF